MKYVTYFKGYLHEYNKDFSAGCISQCLAAWESLTSDQQVPQTVKKLKLEFDEIPVSSGLDYLKTLKTELTRLLEKDAIVACNQEIEEFVSPIFLKKKADSSKKLILSSKTLNKNLEY